MKSRILVAVAAVGLVVTGCEKKQTPPETPPTPTVGTNAAAASAPAAPAQGQAQPQAQGASASGNPVTAPMDYLSAVGKAQETAIKQIDFASVNQAIQQFNAGEGRYPKDLNELVAERYLGKIPQTPPGWGLQYDAAQGTVQIVRRQAPVSSNAGQK